MTAPTNKYADFEALREQAITLRRAGLSRRQIRDRIHADNNDLLDRLLENYRGCLVINVLKGADLYRRTEGWWTGIVRYAEGGLG
jgi:hypothetical protein